MKRIITCVLALSLLCAFLTLPAQAAEPVQDPEPAQTAEMKPVYEWTDEEWATAMEDWTYEETETYAIWWYEYEYRLAENGEIDEYYDELFTAMSSWTDDQSDFYYSLFEIYYGYEEELRIAEEKLRIEQEKVVNGFPYLDGINLHVNGEFVTFDGPRAVMKNGVTYVPIDTLAEALGDGCEYVMVADKGEISLHGNTVGFTAGMETTFVAGYELDWETYERVEVFKTAIPYLEDSSLMVPLRAVTNELDCELKWLQDYQTAMVIDTQALVDKINEDFTVMNRFIPAFMNSFYGGEDTVPLEFTSHTELLGMLYGENENMSALLRADTSVIVNGADIRTDITVDTDAENLKPFYALLLNTFSWYSGVNADEKADKMVNSLQTYIDGTHSMIVKGRDAYIKSPSFGQQMPAAAGKWIHGEIEETDTSAYFLSGSEMFEAFLGLTGTTVGDYVVANAGYSSYRFTDHYEQLLNEASIYALFIGDDAFNSANGTYTLTGSLDSLFDALAAEGKFTEENREYFIGPFGGNFNYSLSFTEDAGRLGSYAFEFTTKSGPAVIGVSVNGGAGGYHFSVSVVGNILGKVVLTVDAESVPTAKTVEAPPESEVIDADAIVGEIPGYTGGGIYEYLNGIFSEILPAQM